MEISALPPQAIVPDIPQHDPSLTSLEPAEIDPRFASSTIDLVSAALGARILSCSDQFFAVASNLISPKAPIRKPGVFVASGAWYDGWETRRHNPNPPDSVTIRVAPGAGIPVGIEVDTAFFNGNHAEHISVLACYNTSSNADEEAQGQDFQGWKTVLDKRKCWGTRRHAWVLPIPEDSATGNEITHVKLQMWPDGGIARFRLYGHVVPSFPPDMDQEVELSASLNGGVATTWSDQHFGKASNILLPGRGVDMGDGWETARSREPGHVDWVIVKLGARGKIKRYIVDTMHFRGNFPKSVRLEGFDGATTEPSPSSTTIGWAPIGRVEQCEKDKEHETIVADATGVVCTHVKLIIEPDGGVKRLRVFGQRV